ncbi:MAG: type IV pilus modification protein PilV [Woeseiaceae bacterium]|nr:type IV pilus modification protein PilV [Woeseiaceae bacterium]
MLINSRKQQRGFSLVEVLIALIIMSVGMLGIATLFVQSMQAGRTSMFRHQAVTMAGDVADRIRANPRAGIAYQGQPADNGCVGAGIDCNEAEMAANDIFLWDAQVDESLPNGTVTVTFDDTVLPPEYTIRIDWDEPGEDPNAPLNYEITIPVLGI